MATCDCCGCVFLSDYGTSVITGEGTPTDPYKVGMVDSTWVRPGARVRRTTTASISNATITPVSFDTEVFDQGNFWDVGAPTLFTIPESGIYLFGGNCIWALSATGTREIGFRLNGSTILLAVDQPPDPTNGAATIIYSHATYQSKFAAGDTLELIVRHEAGGALSINAEADDSVVFWIVYAGKAV